MTSSASESRPGRFRALRTTPLRYADFQALWLSVIFAGTGGVGETVVLGWLLLERTDSPLVVGAGIALRAVPNFFLGLPSGALVDRLDRRLVLRFCSIGHTLAAAVPAGLALSGQLEVWHLFAFTLVGGGIRSVGQAARQSYAFDIVGPLQVVAGTAFISMGQRVGSIAGSLAAGLILGLGGAGAAYLAIALMHFLSGLAIMLARARGQAAPVSRPPVWQGMGEYLAELRVNRMLALLVVLTAAVEVLGFSHQAVVPSLARDLLDVGPGGLGLLNASAAIGGTLAIVLLSLRGEFERRGLVFLIVLILFGASLILLGLGGSFVLALLAIALVGALAALSDLLSLTLVQSAVPNELRGRAMGSWMLAVGLGPVGYLQIGVLASLVGVMASLLVNGALLSALALGVLLWARTVRRL